eukprot:COSAG05_NODE_4174_length_1640_cov_1.292667_1_plen_114_part_00
MGPGLSYGPAGADQVVSGGGNSSALNVMRLLLENSADPGIADSAGCTPLIAAAEAGHLQIVILLLEFKAPIDAVFVFTPKAMARATRHHSPTTGSQGGGQGRCFASAVYLCST